jgi:hypothetical protein
MNFAEWWKEIGNKNYKRMHMNIIAKSHAKEAWQASRENMQEYGKYEFCRAVECENMQEKCMVGDGYCSFTAKELHHWLKENGYRIVRD